MNFLTCRVKNPDITRAGRGGAVHGATAGSCWAGPEQKSTVWLAQKKTFSGAQQSTEGNYREQCFGSTNKDNPTCRVQILHKQRAGRVGASYGGRRGRESWAEQGADISEANRLSGPPRYRKQLF